jgi:hypothetical protein
MLAREFIRTFADRPTMHLSQQKTFCGTLLGILKTGTDALYFSKIVRSAGSENNLASLFPIHSSPTRFD